MVPVTGRTSNPRRNLWRKQNLQRSKSFRKRVPEGQLAGYNHVLFPSQSTEPLEWNVPRPQAIEEAMVANRVHSLHQLVLGLCEQLASDGAPIYSPPELLYPP